MAQGKTAQRVFAIKFFAVLRHCAREKKVAQRFGQFVARQQRKAVCGGVKEINEYRILHLLRHDKAMCSPRQTAPLFPNGHLNLTIRLH